MKHLKLFDTQNELQEYNMSKWISPHIYLNKQDKTLSYEKRFTQLEYIESNKYQYIDLDLKLFDSNPINFKIDMVYMISSDNSKEMTLFSAKQENGAYPGILIRYNIYNSGHYSGQPIVDITYKESQSDYINGEFLTNNSKNFNAPPRDINNNIQYNSIDTIMRCNYEFNFSSNQYHNITTTLFCSLNSSGTPFRHISGRIYSLKLWKQGKLVRNLVPVKTKEEIGLYDILHKHFYKSQGPKNLLQVQ